MEWLIDKRSLKKIRSIYYEALSGGDHIRLLEELPELFKTAEFAIALAGMLRKVGNKDDVRKIITSVYNLLEGNSALDSEELNPGPTSVQRLRMK